LVRSFTPNFDMVGCHVALAAREIRTLNEIFCSSDTSSANKNDQSMHMTVA